MHGFSFLNFSFAGRSVSGIIGILGARRVLFAACFGALWPGAACRPSVAGPCGRDPRLHSCPRSGMLSAAHGRGCTTLAPACVRGRVSSCCSSRKAHGSFSQRLLTFLPTLLSGHRPSIRPAGANAATRPGLPRREPFPGGRTHIRDYALRRRGTSSTELRASNTTAAGSGNVVKL